MSYYVRHFMETPQGPTLESIIAFYRATKPEYNLRDDALHFGDELVAQITVDTKGSDLFDEEILEFQEMLSEKRASKGKTQVAEFLTRANTVVALQLLGDPGRSWDLMSPIFTHLAEFGPGLTQVDGVGFYEGRKLVLRLE